MLNLLAGLLGAGGSIAGSIIGANAQDDASERNWAINLLNYYSREQERRDRIRMAETERRERKLGMTDAQGNRVHFVEGVGWVTDMSPEGKTMNDAQNNEQMQRLLVDLPMRRKKMQEVQADQATDKYLSEGALDAYKRSGELPSEGGARARTQALAGTNQNWDNILNALMRKATRTGSSGVGRMLTDVLAGRTQDANLAGARAYSAGEATSEQAAANRGGNFLNIYNALSQKSRGMPAAQYTPQNVTGNADKMLGSAANRADDAGNQAIAAYGAKGGTMDYVEPSYGWANTVSGAGQALGSMFGNLSSYYDKRRAQGQEGWA